MPVTGRFAVKIINNTHNLSMRKLFTLLASLFVFTAVNAKQKHVVKHHPVAHAYHGKRHHATHHHIVKARPIDPAILAKIDTSAAPTYTGVQQMLYELVKELGKPYKLGSCGPTCFDCSGLMNYAFSIIGVQLPRTSTDIGQIGEKIAFDELKPGDLLFFSGRNNRSKNKHIGHVGCVYNVDKTTGKVLMIHSSDEGVNIVDLNDSKYYMDRLITARRIPVTDTCTPPSASAVKRKR